MSTNENLTPSDDQAITIQPSGIAAYPGSGDWIQAGSEEAGQTSLSGLAALHAIRRHLLLVLSMGLVCATVAAILLYITFPVKYKATAVLQLAPSTPRILGKTNADQAQQVMNEFEIFRDSQASLIKTNWIMIAALRDPDLKNRECIRKQDEKHDAIQWLTEEIRVDFPAKNGGVMYISATEPDPQDAMSIVNSVMRAYMAEFGDIDRVKQEHRLAELQRIHSEKEVEVRRKREELKQEFQNAGGLDEEGMRARTQLAISTYAEFQREFQRMKSEKRVLDGKLTDAKKTLADLQEAEIPEADVVMLLNNNLVYRDLKSREAMLTAIDRVHNYAAAPGTKEPAGFGRTKAELEAAKAQIQELEDHSRDMVRGAKRIALKTEINHLESQVDVAAGQIAAFEKEVEKKSHRRRRRREEYDHRANGEGRRRKP